MEISLKQMIDKGEAILQARERAEKQELEKNASRERQEQADRLEKFLALVPEPLRWHVRFPESNTSFTLDVAECAPIYAYTNADNTRIDSILVPMAVNYGGGEPFFSENRWDLVKVVDFIEALGLARRFHGNYVRMQAEYQAKTRKAAEQSKRDEQEQLYGMQVEFEAGHDERVQLDEAVNCIMTASASDDPQTSQTEAQIGATRMLVAIYQQLKRIADAHEAENERMQLEVERRELLHEYGSHGS